MKNTNVKDYIIVGAGPAGIQLGYYMEKANKDYVILEGANRPGAFFETYPRHRTLISINKRFTGSSDPEFNMRHDWNSLISDDFELLFKDFDEKFFPDADSLLSYLSEFVNKFSINIRYNTFIHEISKTDDVYRLIDGNGVEHFAKTIIIATGFCKPYTPDIDGIEHAVDYSEMSIDRKDFENKRVLIIGKGNSAFETGDHLVSSAAVIHLASPNSLVMAWKSHYVGNLRAVNNNILDTYQLKSQNAIIDANVKSIKKVGEAYDVTFAYQHAEGEVETLQYDTVLCCTGFSFDNKIFKENAKPESAIKGKFPKLKNNFESVNQSDMFFAGTLTHSLDYKKATSGFIHGFRYNSKSLFKILSKRNEGVDWPEVPLKKCSSSLTQKILTRVNQSGGLWQQPSFMADYFYLNNGRVYYGEEMPVAHVCEALVEKADYFYTVTLEYGADITGDPFNVERIHRENADSSSSSQFLHPIVREYFKGICISEHHVIEDLESKWVENVHIEPLKAYLENKSILSTVQEETEVHYAIEE